MLCRALSHIQGPAPRELCLLQGDLGRQQWEVFQDGLVLPCTWKGNWGASSTAPHVFPGKCGRGCVGQQGRLQGPGCAASR